MRKLVLETAKFNVLTAHSTREAIDIFQSFPNVSTIIAVEDPTIDCERVTATVKNAAPAMPVIALSAREGFKCSRADHQISSHEPEQLLNTIRKLLGDPRNIKF